MVVIAVAALILGILTGTFWHSGLTVLLTASSDYILYLLMFLVGISIGLHRGKVLFREQTKLRLTLAIRN